MRTALLFPLWHHIPEMAWPEACVSLATSCGWVGADTLFSVCVSKWSRWDAVPAGFSKRARAVQPRAVGWLPGFEKVFEASRLPRAPRPCSLSPPNSPAGSFDRGRGCSECLGSVQPPETSVAEDGECSRITFQGQRFGKDERERRRKLNVARSAFSFSAG